MIACHFSEWEVLARERIDDMYSDKYVKAVSSPIALGIEPVNPSKYTRLTGAMSEQGVIETSQDTHSGDKSTNAFKITRAWLIRSKSRAYCGFIATCEV
jgi:hypothetical protein